MIASQLTKDGEQQKYPGSGKNAGHPIVDSKYSGGYCGCLAVASSRYMCVSLLDARGLPWSYGCRNSRSVFMGDMSAFQGLKKCPRGTDGRVNKPILMHSPDTRSY